MIKRRFYKIDRGDRDALDPSSSSSDSEVEVEAAEESGEEEEEDEDKDDAVEVKQDDEASSTSSGYESEDGSANDVDVNSAGLLFSEDDAGTINERQVHFNKELSSKHGSEVMERKSNVLAERESLPADMPSYILKCKSVFKCRICPRIICLTAATLRDHLKSKRHARSEKLLREGRLKAMLNSDGEIENQEVSESEIQTKDTEDKAKKNSEGRKQNKKRWSKKEKSGNINTKKMVSTKGPAKRRRKNEN